MTLSSRFALGIPSTCMIAVLYAVRMTTAMSCLVMRTCTRQVHAVLPEVFMRDEVTQLEKGTCVMHAQDEPEEISTQLQVNNPGRD